MAKKITLNRIKKLTPEEIGKMTKDEITPYLEKAREEFTKRGKTFERNPIVYSRVYEKMKDYYDDKGMRPPITMSRNREVAELIRLIDMFNDKTSTVKGAREENIKEDKKLFGVNHYDGTPKFRMRPKTRKLFWAAYDEFNHQHPEMAAKFPSEFIQQALGDVMIDSVDEGVVDLGTLVTKLERFLRTGNMREENRESGDEDGGFKDTVAYRKARLNRNL